MAKCRTLQEENEEIGNQASEGKVQSSYLPYAFHCHIFPFHPLAVLVTGCNFTLAYVHIPTKLET